MERSTTRRDFLKATCLAAGLGLLPTGCASVQSSGRRRSPNIVLILADDLGYMDVAAYAEHLTGTPRSAMFYETPHIDSLVDKGINFSQAYSMQLCSPTRTSILTGRYHCKVGMTTAFYGATYNPDPPVGYHAYDSPHSDPIQQQQAWLNAKVLGTLPAGAPNDQGWDEVCLPEMLTGYHSAFIGKWHVGGGGIKGYQPQDQGFSEVIWCNDAGGMPFFNWRRRPGAKPETSYLTDGLTDMAVDFIQRQAQTPQRPFFLDFCHFAVHLPLQAKQEEIDYFSKKPTRGWNGHNEPTYAAMIKSLDNSVGRVVEALRQTGQLEDTVIVFVSDNGGKAFQGPTTNTPLREGKAFLCEGGIRVPLTVWQPRRFEGGRWTDVPAHCVDIFPTLAALANQSVRPNVDGVSLVPLLEDPANKRKKIDPDRPLYWHYPFNVIWRDAKMDLPLTPHSGMRKGDYKLIWDWHGRLQLFNLARDIGEKQDLSEREPERTMAMFRELVDWLDANVERRYFPTPNPAYDAAKDKRPYPLRDLPRELLGRTAPLGQPDAMGKNSGRMG